MNPRLDPACPECPGELAYVEQTTDARGDVVSLFECINCGKEVRQS